MRSPSQMDIVQIDVTNKCHLRCSNCTRLVAHQAEPFQMDLETFQRALESMRGWYEPGKVLGVMGGEPTLHDQFEDIARLFAHWWGHGRVSRHGRTPIKDFNAYVQERLQDRASGRGLWTSLGPGYYKHYELIQEVFDHQTVNTHEHPGLHQALLITRKELGIRDDHWHVLRDKCWVQNLWSASITPHGAYFCEVAGAIDNLFYQGAHAWPIEEGWWKRTPEQFGDQLDLCEHCALALPVAGVEARKNRDLISPASLTLLERAGSPAVARGKVDVWNPGLELDGRQVDSIDSYLPEERVRVAAGHKSILPKSVVGVVVCVGCADQLRATLPFNLSQLEEILVVTTPEDEATKQVVAQSPRARLVVSGRCYDEDHAFNKGRLLNDALQTLEQPDWIVFHDADVLLNQHLKEFLAAHALNLGCLYGTLRLDAIPWECQPDPTGLNAEPNGYFQLFNRRALAIRERWPALLSESFCSAGGVDSWFLQQFPVDKRIVLPELAVSHFGHGAFGKRWNGTRQRGWRQVGLLVPGQVGIIWTESEVPINHPLRFLLTDTLHARQATLKIPDGAPIPQEVLERTRDGGFCFQGQDIGRHHIHVAAWFEGASE